MSEQEEFFSKKHNQLFIIATWAKYLSWLVLAGAVILTAQNLFTNLNAEDIPFKRAGISIPSLIDLFFLTPANGLSYLFEAANIFINGVATFLLLKGVSLGLNMIVETDVNYREKNLRVEDER